MDYDFRIFNCQLSIINCPANIRYLFINYQLVLHDFKMIVHKNIQQLPTFRNAVITIGTFDGVHTGHQQILQLMKTEAAAANGETVIITFHPHPRKIVASEKAPIFLLNTLEEKIELLEKAGINHLVVVPFTEKFANQTAEEYINDFLVKTFHPHSIIIGYDHHFGKGRKGNYQLLEAKGIELNYQVKEIPVHVLEEVSISSTKIRNALLQGDVATANACLGYSYFFSGKVIEGNKLGRTIGYPTANLQIQDEDKLVPGNGVYAVEVNIQSSILNIKYFGMMNIGVRPTIDGTKRLIEVNIFDFDKSIYNETLTVTVRKHLRSEKKFNDLEELKEQLAKDKNDSIEYFKLKDSK